MVLCDDRIQVPASHLTPRLVAWLRRANVCFTYTLFSRRLGYIVSFIVRKGVMLAASGQLSSPGPPPVQAPGARLI
jgi:hypothetical protein